MKLTRAQFLKALPAAALVLAGCTAAPTAPADTDELVFDPPTRWTTPPSLPPTAMRTALPC